MPNNYGVHLGFGDADYKNLGVNFLSNEEEIIKNSEIVIQLDYQMKKIIFIERKPKFDWFIERFL